MQNKEPECNREIIHIKSRLHNQNKLSVQVQKISKGQIKMYHVRNTKLQQNQILFIKKIVQNQK
jgi:hypothetical protein